jgi:hypothetical protein
MRNFILLFLSFLISIETFSSHNYLNPSGALGGGTGADWSNAKAYSVANLVRGVTNYVADGTASGNKTYNIAASGTDNVIIRKATASDHGTDTGWISTMGDGQFLHDGDLTINTPYWRFEGVIGGGPYATNDHGIKIFGGGGGGGIVTMTGTADHIYFGHIELEHEDTRYIAVNGASNDSVIFKCTTAAIDDVTIEYCYAWNNVLHIIHSIGASNWLVQYNRFGPTGVGFGSGTPEDLHRAGYAGLGDSNMTFRWNYWKDISNTAIVAFVNGGDNSNIHFYGNIIDMRYSEDCQVSFIDAAHASSTQVNFKFYNNTLYGWRCGGAKIFLDNDTGCESRNNIFYDFDAGNFFFSGTHTHSSFESIIVSSSNVDATFASGEGSGGQNLSANPFNGASTGDFTLTVAATTAIDDGFNVGAPYNVDMYGNTNNKRGAISPDSAYDDPIGGQEQGGGTSGGGSGDQRVTINGNVTFNGNVTK